MAVIALAGAGRASAQLEPMEPAPPQPYEPTAPSAPSAPQIAAPDAPTQPEYLTEGEGGAAAAEPGYDSGSNWGEPSDHQRVVGRLAVGYLGVNSVPVHSFGDDPDATISAPTLGIRYWFNEGLGLDAGLGLGLDTAGGTSTTQSTEADLPGSSLFAFALHVGLPISAWSTGHYNALLIPEVNFGFATGDNDGLLAGTGDDISVTGLLFQVGLRAGAEFHLEYFDVPQATLQLTIGIGLAVEMRDREVGLGLAGESLTALHLRTNLRSLGSALASGIQAFFYF